MKNAPSFGRPVVGILIPDSAGTTNVTDCPASIGIMTSSCKDEFAEFQCARAKSPRGIDVVTIQSLVSPPKSCSVSVILSPARKSISARKSRITLVWAPAILGVKSREILLKAPTGLGEVIMKSVTAPAPASVDTVKSVLLIRIPASGKRIPALEEITR